MSSGKRKIGVFLESEPYGGGTFQYNLAILEAVRSLPIDSFEIVFAYEKTLWQAFLSDLQIPISHQIEVKSHLLGRIVGRALRAIGLPLKFWRDLSPYFHSISRTLVQQKCDLWIFPAQSGWTYQAPVRALGVIHDLMHRYEGEFPERKSLYSLHEESYINICRWSVGILVDSEVGKYHVQESYGTPPERIHVLPYIAPAYMFERDFVEGFDTRYHLPEKYIFYPAQFWQHKNHKNLLLACSQLKDRFPDLNLVFSGSKKNAFEDVFTMVENLNLKDRVHYLGYVPNEDMPGVYQRAHALVMPTFWGPTNIPPLEAMVVGCPVAVSDIYGMREQLGDAALFFDPSKPEEIASVITQLWENESLCNDLKEKGYRKIKSWNQLTFNARFAEIIQTIERSHTSSEI